MSFSLIFFSWALPLLFLEKSISAPFQESSLVLVHVLFRHGNRTPHASGELYPKDPYAQEKYFPIGLGQLTNAGKRKEYSLGKALRDRYNRFLGAAYYPEIVDASSTDVNRTKMSLELVLAGLFPPRGEEVWKPGFNWQPIPYNYIPESQDKILLGVTCPRYLELYDEVVHSPRLQTEFSKYKTVFDYISTNTGLNITTFQDVYNLYFALSTEEEWGFKLPPWTAKVWPTIITNLAVKEYYVATATTDLKRMASGYFLQKIICDTHSKINGIHKLRKIYLYSAHENNLAELLILLGVFEHPHVPTYGSYITFEIYKINNTYGVRISYENYTRETPQLLKLPACESTCEINRFVSLVDEYLPKTDICGKKK